MSKPRTEAGRALFTDMDPMNMLESNGVTPDDVTAIEDEARRDAFAEIEAAVGERMHGGVWLSEAHVLDIVKTVREAASTDD